MRKINYLLALLVALCAAPMTFAQAPNGGGDGDAVAVPEESSMTIENEGEAPRHKLRYDFPIGVKETMVMDMHVVVNAGPRNVDTPPMRMVADITTQEKTEEGNFRQKVEFTDVTVQARPQDPQAMVQAMRNQLDGMKGLTGTGVLSPRGKMIESDFEVPKNAPPQLRQQLQQTKRTMSQMSVLLPEQALGKGAKWTVKQPISNQGFELVQTATYTVQEINENGVVLDLQISQTAPEQAMPNGVKLTSFNTDGKGKINLTFKKQVPTAQMQLNMQLEQEMRGQTMNIGVNMDIDIGPPEEEGADNDEQARVRERMPDLRASN